MICGGSLFNECLTGGRGRHYAAYGLTLKTCTKTACRVVPSKYDIVTGRMGRAGAQRVIKLVGVLRLGSHFVLVGNTRKIVHFSDAHRNVLPFSGHVMVLINVNDTPMYWLMGEFLHASNCMVLQRKIVFTFF